jgi:5-formyltetrahydrofolate cyclo-ligase
MNEPNIAVSKDELRLRFRQASRDYLTADVHKNIIEFLLQVVPARAKVGAFMALSDEPNLSGLFLAGSQEFAFPRIDGLDLSFYIPAAGAKLQVNTLGVSEPAIQGSKKISSDELGAILVPGVAFDKKCQRLGRGKGYYDRLLSGYKGLKIGVASVAQIASDDLPVDPHDVAMDVVVTDRYVLRRFDS